MARLFDGFHGHRMPDDEEGIILVGRSQPIEFLRIELRQLVAVERIERQRVIDQSQGQAIFGRDVV